MPDLKLDVSAWPVAAGIDGAIVAEFAKRGIILERHTVQHGPQPVFDITEDGCGVGSWVRVMTKYPSLSFPDQDDAPTQVARGPMPPQSWAVQLEVGAAHCSVQWEIGDGVKVPTEEEYAADTELSLAEMQALQVAICNYLNTTKRRYVMGAYTPIAQGGMIGGYWTVTVESNKRVN
jgi:hypothetical protein